MNKKNFSILLFLCLVICFSFDSFGQDDRQKARVLYNQGQKAYKEKNFPLFLKTYQKLEALMPGSRVVLNNLACAYSLNKQKEKALLYLEKLVALHADPAIKKDTDFDFLRSSKRFREILKRIDQMQKPISNSETAFVIKERDLHPESVAYDEKTNTFYISSVHKRKIVYLDKDGTIKEFTTKGQDGLDAVMGIRIDSAKRVLWASCNAIPHMLGYNAENDKYRTGVFKYNLDTKKLLKKYVIRESGRGFDDVAFHPSGDVYISDNIHVYRVPASTDKLEMFMEAPEINSLQGLDFCDKGTKMFAADWAKGLFLYDLNTRKLIAKLEHPKDISLVGIDGLYYLEKSNSLIAVQNGVFPMRVMRYYLDKGFTKVVKYDVIEWAHPEFHDPTLGVLVKDGTFYYVANSQWKSYNKDFSIFPKEKLKDIL
ncbi:MAG: hypothetical protein GY765_06740, partial [bacterium]|nr:hypothetical protein [bacterium]